MYVLCLHSEAYHCRPPGIITNTSAEYIDDLTLAVTCLPGHRYPDGYNVKFMYCVNGQWAPYILPACKRKTIRNVHNKYLP